MSSICCYKVFVIFTTNLNTEGATYWGRNAHSFQNTWWFALSLPISQATNHDYEYQFDTDDFDVWCYVLCLFRIPLMSHPFELRFSRPFLIFCLSLLGSGAQSSVWGATTKLVRAQTRYSCKKPHISIILLSPSLCSHGFGDPVYSGKKLQMSIILPSPSLWSHRFSDPECYMERGCTSIWSDADRKAVSHAEGGANSLHKIQQTNFNTHDHMASHTTWPPCTLFPYYTFFWLYMDFEFCFMRYLPTISELV